eukprot:jgi/Mesvir1/20969/Mv08036-RA.1
MTLAKARQRGSVGVSCPALLSFQPGMIAISVLLLGLLPSIADCRLLPPVAATTGEAGTYEKIMEGIGEHMDATLHAFGTKMEKHVTPHIPELKQMVVNEAGRLSQSYTKYEKSLEDIVAPHAGRYTPFVCTLVILLLVGMPFGLVVYFCFGQIASLLTMDKLLMVANAYGFTFFLILLVFTVLHGDPMRILQANYGEGYVVFQLGMSFVFSLYLLLHCGMFCTVQLLCTAAFRILSSFAIGLVYYISIWEPAMMDEPPNGSSAAWTYLFLILLFFVNICLPKVGSNNKLGIFEAPVETDGGIRNTDD